MCQPSVQTCLNTTTIQIWQPLLGLSQPNFGEPLSMQTLSLSQPDSADYLGKVADYKASNTELKLKCSMLLRATVLSPKSILWCSHCWFVSSEMLFKTKSEKSVISSSGWKQTAADFVLLFLHENQMGCPNTSGGVGVGLLSAFMSQQIRRPS